MELLPFAIHLGEDREPGDPEALSTDCFRLRFSVAGGAWKIAALLRCHLSRYLLFGAPDNGERTALPGVR